MVYYGRLWYTMVDYGRLAAPLYIPLLGSFIFDGQNHLLFQLLQTASDRRKSLSKPTEAFLPRIDLEMFTSRHGAFAQRRVLAAARPAVAVG